MLKGLIVAAVTLSLITMPALGDVIYLQDGRVIEGEITDITDEAILIRLSGDEDRPLTLEIPKAQVVYAAYAVNEQSLARAGEALMRARTLFFLGLALNVAGVLVAFIPGPSSSLIGGVAILGGWILSLMAYWNIGTAGEYLIQASR